MKNYRKLVKNTRICVPVVAIAVWLSLAPAARAHFVVLLPSTDSVEAGDDASVRLDLLFTHPMEQGPVMEMARPRRFGAIVAGKKIDLLESLKPRKVEGKTAYRCETRIATPGDHVFFVEPAPYWEPAEQKMIVHSTKVVVAGLGAETGWDAIVGSAVEISPLVRPYGLWTGMTFRGVVLRHGKPAAGARVEIEYWNEGRHVKTSRDAQVSQVLKTDAAGTFCFTMPRAGWWGFAALVTGDEKMTAPDGKPVDVEQGGLMWVKAVDVETK